MKRIFGGLFLVLGLASACAQTAAVTPPCRSDRIGNSNGMQLSLQSGQAYQGYPGSQGTLSTWLPLDRVTVCPIGGAAAQITNLSKKDKTIRALRIYPANSGTI